MTSDATSTDEVEEILRRAEDEIVRLRNYGSPGEKADAAERLKQSGFVMAGDGRLRNSRP